MQSDRQFHRVLAALDLFEKKVDGRFDSLDDRFELVDERFKAVERCITGLKADCVTRDYLDHQLLDVRGDIATLVRKEDYKVNSLLDVLRVNQVISVDDRDRLLDMGPFPNGRKA